jgi:hypothetical protein
MIFSISENYLNFGINFAVFFIVKYGIKMVIHNEKICFLLDFFDALFCIL